MKPRRSVSRVLVLFLIAGGLFSSLRGEDPDAEKRLREHVSFLASPDLRGRGMLADRRKAADYLEQEYRKLGLQPLFPGSYQQEIPLPAKAGEPTMNMGVNVGALLPGGDPKLKDEWIILSAHYDHLTPGSSNYYPGADDNASGVAMVLEVARALKLSGKGFKRSIAFVNFDLEESLLWGSRWFVAHPPLPLEELKLFMTADLLGRNVGDLPLRMLFVMGSEHGTGLEQYLPAVAEGSQLQIGRLGIDIVGTRSDYGTFRDKEIPFLFFSTGQHPDYHTPRDRPERLLYDKLKEICLFIEGVVRRAADDAETPHWIAKPAPSREELKTIQQITAVLLDPKTEKKLTDRQRLFVAQFDAQLRELLKRESYTKEEHAKVVRSTQWLMVMLF
ncbi:MAG: M20/M25/M40 family metallo-hydrolase [Planctomycetales bacterium]